MSEKLTNGWHLDKRVSVGHIATTVVVAASIVLWLAKLESRIELNSQAINNNTERIGRVSQRQTEQYNEILKRLESIDSFLRSQGALK